LSADRDIAHSILDKLRGRGGGEKLYTHKDT